MFCQMVLLAEYATRRGGDMIVPFQLKTCTWLCREVYANRLSAWTAVPLNNAAGALGWFFINADRRH